MAEEPSASGVIEIRGTRWEWATVEDFRGSRPGEPTESDARTAVRFRDPDNPASQMWCPVEEAKGDELTDETLRKLFGKAWAISP